jgi:hypothetical protein
MAPDDKVKLPRIRKKDLKKLGPDEELLVPGQPEFDLEQDQSELGSPILGTIPDPRDQLGNR